MKINLDDLTLGQIKEIKNLIGIDNNNVCDVKIANKPYEINKKYLIRSVTNYFVGRLVEIYEKELVLKEASWVASTGDFNKACMTGELNEIEPYNPNHRVIVGRGSIIDASPWDFDLPKERK